MPLRPAADLLSLRVVSQHEVIKRWVSGQGVPFWSVNLIFWTLFGASVFLVRWMLHGDVMRALGFMVVSEGAAFGISLLLRPIFRKLPFELSTALLIAIASLGSSLLLAGISHTFSLITGWQNPFFSPLTNFLARVLFMWIVFLGWSFAYFWLKTASALRSETQFAEEAVQEAHRMELQMLRAQLDPHFLFNSLNGIVAEIRPHPETATEMVRELSDYLRYSLDHRNRVLSPLSSELDAMKAYLQIEKSRFGERLNVLFDVSDAARWHEVPSFLLQPLIENAIKHGLQNSSGPMTLHLSASVSADLLDIEITNTGHLPDRSTKHAGLGLDTLRRRLDLHYPKRHVFTLSEENGIVRAKLQLRGDPCCA